MRIISIRETPAYKDLAIKYFQQSWKSIWPIIYEDAINNCINAKNDLPQWYLLEKGKEIIGCAGLITNDFISRGDLYPWVCALFVDEDHRGNAYGSLLLDKAKNDAKKIGYEDLHLCTDHIGYYEKYGFEYIGQGYHPWKAESRIYQIKLE
jgi:N-acetylglutamate synthase-like GNAT family acetyltransferase